MNLSTACCASKWSRRFHNLPPLQSQQNTDIRVKIPINIMFKGKYNIDIQRQRKTQKVKYRPYRGGKRGGI